MRQNKTTKQTIDPMVNHYITRDINDEPVSLYEFCKKDNDYLLVTKILSTIPVRNDTHVCFVCEGMIMSSEMYRHITIDMLLN